MYNRLITLAVILYFSRFTNNGKADNCASNNNTTNDY